VDEAEVTTHRVVPGNLGADSLDVVELVMQFEEAFDLEISRRGRREDQRPSKDAIEYIDKNAKGGSKLATTCRRHRLGACIGRRP